MFFNICEEFGVHAFLRLHNNNINFYKKYALAQNKSLYIHVSCDDPLGTHDRVNVFTTSSPGHLS